MGVQIVAVALNTLSSLPFALLLRTIGGLSRRAALLVSAAVSIVVPFFFWNNTFTWTKDLTAAFVLMGIYTYLTAYRKGDRNGMVMSITYLAPGFLCHYLTLIYAGVLGLHLLLVVPLRELPIRSLLRATSIWGVLAGSWFGYMFATFGVNRTLSANDTIGSYLIARDEHARPIPYPRVAAANLCTDLVPLWACRPLLPSNVATECVSITVGGRNVVRTTVPCPQELRWNGIYDLLRYSGLLAVLAAAAVSARPLLRIFRHLKLGAIRGKTAGDEPTFLLWVLAAGLLLNLLPIRWFDPGGSFGENLQAWCMVFFAITIRGLLRLPPLIALALGLAMFVEFSAVDLWMIRQQAVVLPLQHDASTGRGEPPLGQVLAGPHSSAIFQADGDYYKNYLLKIKGGALYFRDQHPDQLTVTSWAMFTLGALLLTAAALGPSKTLPDL